MRFLRFAPLAALLFACGSDDGDTKLVPLTGGQAGATAGSAAKGGSDTGRVCVPNKQESCACPGGETGVQRCADDGKSFLDCECPSGKGGTGGKGGKGGSEGGEGGEAGEAGEGGSSGTGGSGGSAGKGGKGGSAGKGGTGGKGGAAGKAGSGGVGPIPGDADGDGWTPEDGDCDDADPLVSPASFDAPGDNVDNDCDGTVDQPATACDEGIGPAGTSPAGAAKAMGLCEIKLGPASLVPPLKWGVIGAEFSDVAGAYMKSPPDPDANPELQIGFLPSMGPATVPLEGARFFALSSGIARAPSQEGFDPSVSCAIPDPVGGAGGAAGQGGEAGAAGQGGAAGDAGSAGSSSGTGGAGGTFGGELAGKKWGSSQSPQPAGFPKANSCGTSGTPNDAIAVDLAIRAPRNARSFSFKYRYFTCEYPKFSCSTFNDVFAVFMNPSPLPPGDKLTDPTNTFADIASFAGPSGTQSEISVNNVNLITVCDPSTEAKEHLLCAGDAPLAGSGFDNHAGSGWLQATVQIPEFSPGADRVIHLRFAIWDSTDQIADSTALVDDFRWSTEEAVGASSVVVP